MLSELKTAVASKVVIDINSAPPKQRIRKRRGGIGLVGFKGASYASFLGMCTNRKLCSKEICMTIRKKRWYIGESQRVGFPVGSVSKFLQLCLQRLPSKPILTQHNIFLIKKPAHEIRGRADCIFASEQFGRSLAGAVPIKMACDTPSGSNA